MSQALDAIVEEFLFPTNPKCRRCGTPLPGPQMDSDSRGLVQTYVFTPVCEPCMKVEMAESETWEAERRARFFHLRTEMPCGCIISFGLHRGSSELWQFTERNGGADRVIFMAEDEWTQRREQPWECEDHRRVSKATNA